MWTRNRTQQLPWESAAEPSGPAISSGSDKSMKVSMHQVLERSCQHGFSLVFTSGHVISDVSRDVLMMNSAVLGDMLRDTKRGG